MLSTNWIAGGEVSIILSRSRLHMIKDVQQTGKVEMKKLFELVIISSLTVLSASFTIASERQVVPLTADGCRSLSSANGISTSTAEYVSKRINVSVHSISLWRTEVRDLFGGDICYFYYDTPVGIKSCWSSMAKSESEEIEWVLGTPFKPVLVKDPGETPFLVMGSCMDFR